MDRTRWIIFGVVCVVLIGALAINKKSDNAEFEKMEPSKVIMDTKNNTRIPDHTYGSKSQRVVLIEYGDFQCPGCANLFPTINALKEKYKEQITFVFRNFPLTTIHANALAASTAAEAAGLQDKWWQYHDHLYKNQTTWAEADAEKRTDIFVEYAKELGLDIKKFKKDFEDKKIENKIDRDLSLGKKIGASSTPTLVLNGEVIAQEKWDTPEKLEELLKEAIKKSGQEI